MLLLLSTIQCRIVVEKNCAKMNVRLYVDKSNIKQIIELESWLREKIICYGYDSSNYILSVKMNKQYFATQDMAKHLCVNYRKDI